MASGTAGADPTVAEPTFHCFWEDLSPRAFAVVEREAAGIAARLRAHAPWAPLNCDLASAAWARAFRAAGVPVAVVSGHYWPEAEAGIEPPSLTDHTWLVVDGALFDPTAGQFARPIRARHYHRAGTLGA